MTRTLRVLLLLEALAFFLAALIHSGYLVRGYTHHAAGVAETVLGSMLVLGAGWSVFRPARARTAALVAQGIALVGTLVGVFTIAVGVGPRTAPDVVYHLVMVLLLVGGLTLTRASADP